MIGTAETHEVRSPGVIAGKPYRLHHGLGAGHMKGNLVETGNLAQPPDVVGDDGVIRTEYRPEVLHTPPSALHALLVKVVAEDVHPIGAGQIAELIAVDIG